MIQFGEEINLQKVPSLPIFTESKHKEIGENTGLQVLEWCLSPFHLL